MDITNDDLDHCSKTIRHVFPTRLTLLYAGGIKQERGFELDNWEESQVSESLPLLHFKSPSVHHVFVFGTRSLHVTADAIRGSWLCDPKPG